MEAYKSKATASMVLGIISCALAWFGYLSIGGLICGIIALVYGVQIRKAGEAEGFQVSDQAKAGFIMGIIGVILNGIFFIACVACAGIVGAAASSGALDGLPWSSSM